MVLQGYSKPDAEPGINLAKPWITSYRQGVAVGHVGAVAASPGEGGAPRKTDLREVVDAIVYVLSTGCARSASPHEFPPEGMHSTE